MGTSFHDQLVATRDKKHSKNHPFFELWAQGKLTKAQTAVYCAQHYHYVSEYLNWMAYEASQIPLRDVKSYALIGSTTEAAAIGLTNANQWPIEGNQNQKRDILRNEKENTQPEDVATVETAERVAGDQNQ